MTPPLPTLLTSDDLPLPELHAAALDGDVFRLDRAFCSIAEFDLPWRRAAVLAGRFAEGYVFCRRSAAWIWGGTGLCPVTHEAFVGGGGGRHDYPAGLRVSSAVLDEHDVVDFGAVRVTCVARTVTDLVRAERYDESTALVVRRLAGEHRVDREACDGILDRRKNLPHKRRARQRLDALGIVVGGLRVEG